MNKEDDSDTEIIKEGTKDGNEYIMYKVISEDKTEYDFVLMVAGSSTGVLLGCLESEDAAMSCFEALKFEYVK